MSDICLASSALLCTFKSYHKVMSLNIEIKLILLFTLQARHLCFGLMNCFSFMLSCQLVLSAVMLLSSFFLLPPPLTGLHILWLTCLTVPLLSLSLIGSSADQDLMTMITGKNDKNFKVPKLIVHSTYM